jgi:hypothetical protein
MDMNKKIIQQIINDVYPKIVNHYGKHKGYEIPKVEVHNNIFARISGIKKMEGDDNPCGECCKETNKIFIYFPYITSRVDLIKTLLHEYKHYLQPRYGYEFYTNLGYKYDNHPYELEAITEENNWKKYIK